jgi:hypothetical protein
MKYEPIPKLLSPSRFSISFAVFCLFTGVYLLARASGSERPRRQVAFGLFWLVLGGLWVAGLLLR